MSRKFLSEPELSRLSSQFFGPQKPREIDYLAYLIDEYELNEWQSKAFPDMLAALRSGARSWLSEKQKVSLVKAIHDYDVYNEDVVTGYLTRGFADRTDAEVMNDRGPGIKSGKDAAANQGDDDFEDDIPF